MADKEHRTVETLWGFKLVPNQSMPAGTILVMGREVPLGILKVKLAPLVAGKPQ